MTQRLRDKVALITGGSSGIGLATARLFLAEGANVAITGRSAQRLAAAAGELGPNVLPIESDAGSAGGAAAAVAATVARFGQLDIVFANAGAVTSTPIGKTSADEFARVLQVNLTAAFLAVQAALPHLGRGAAVVFTGSAHADLGNPNMAAYAASKAGVRSMARVLASELGPRGIRVNVVIPGPTRTPARAARAASPEALAALEAKIARSIPLGNLGESEDVAYAVLYLASDEARHVTGAELAVDGGSSVAPGGAPIYRT